MTQPAQPLYTLGSKTQPQIRDDILRTISNHLRGLGITNPNVGPTSDYWGIATGVANEICVGLANNIISVDNNMPDTAGGSYLDRWLNLFNTPRRGATNSAGVVTPSYSLTQGYTNITQGMQLTDAAGLRYAVSVGGQYGPGNPGMGQPANPYVPVLSVDTGAGTDHANGDTLTWVTAPAFCGQQVTVGTTGGTDGLSGGNDSEVGQDEPPRNRFFAKLQNPPASGNWSDVCGWCEDASPDVQAGFCYPALLGPATVFFAVTSAPQTTGTLSSTSKNRDLSASLMNGTVIPFVQGVYPTQALVVGTSVQNQPCDIALLLTLPSAPGATPAGPGGGWVDGSPWPVSIDGTSAVSVTDVTSSTVFTVNATTPPSAGVSHVAWISHATWSLYTATVLSYTGSSGAYVLTIDTPMPGIAVGNFLFPQSVQQQNYLAAALAGFAQLGPGEWTSIGSIYTRAFRHPVPAQTWPYSLDARFLRLLEDAGPEVETAQWLYREATTPTVPSSVTVNDANPPALTSDPPSILVPRNIAWYAQ